MQIRAAVFEQRSQPFVLRDLELSGPGEGELIVEVLATGICHTDIGMQAFHPLPSVLGHEGCGRVLECGAGVKNLKPGDLVVLTFGSCGSCHNCHRDLPSHCEHMMALNFGGKSANGELTLKTADGQGVHGSFFSQSSFASHALVTERNAIAIDDPAASPAMLAPLGCGVQTGAGAIINTLKVEAGSSLVCFGVGAVGLSGIMAAKLQGCKTIIAVDINPQRLSLAEDLGATHSLIGDGSVVEAIAELTGGGADYALETAGTVDTFHSAIACTRMGGHTAIVTIPNWAEGFHFKGADLALGRSVTGVLEGSSRPHQFIPQLYQWFCQGQLPLDRLVKQYAFADINQALADLEQGLAIKPVLMM